MSVESVFDWTCIELERATPLNALESRGTIRIALKKSGLEAQTVSPGQMNILLRRVLPQEFEARDIPDARELCAILADRLGQQGFESASRESADAFFARLGTRS